MRECSYDGCERPARGGNTICKPHQAAEWRERQGPCSVDGCDRKATAAGGLCQMHYHRKLRGFPGWDSLAPQRMKRDGECAKEGCSGPVQARGYCVMHYQRIAALGHADTGPVGRLKAKSGEGGSDGRGYRVITVDGQRYLEHRYVMECQLGRPLWPDETVHHKNDHRADNDPSNLELWAKAQPAGQRVADIMDFYVRRYPDEARRVLGSLGGQ